MLTPAFATAALALGGAFFHLAHATPTGSEAACTSFALSGDALAHVALNETTYYPANTTIYLDSPLGALNASTLPAFCRLQLDITTNTTAGSIAKAEVWLPDGWNGRALTVGNGGGAGGIAVSDLGHAAVRQGFAGMSTNTGHDGSVFSATFGGPHNDNAIVDFGWRAMRETVLAGKEIISQYYQTAASKSYYLGCSSGGREGLKELQAFPEDFDGVVVGSPANWWTHLTSWSLHLNQVVQPANSSRFVTPDQWANVIAPEVLKQCDALDGLEDGIINDPRFCNFDADVLLCADGQTDDCLTADQLTSVKKAYSDYYEGDEYVFGRYFPAGGEAALAFGLLSSAPFELALDYYRYFVLNDTSFQLDDYNASALHAADAINPGTNNAIDVDLTPFAAAPHNGKLIHYVGWADQLISVGNSLHYYGTVKNFTESNTNLKIDDFYRFFPVAGMLHCAGGNAATSFGAANDVQPPISDDAQHNVLAAMVRWVEEGIPPETFTAAAYNGGDAANGVNYTRPICKFPLTLRYKGRGDANSADSFECVEP